MNSNLFIVMCDEPLRPSTRRRPRCCREHTFTSFPNTFEELEREVKRWIHRCVTSRTLDGNGIPFRREIQLVENSNLRDLWDESLSGRRGQSITIHVQYLVDAQQELRLIFSSSGARVRTGQASIVRIEPALTRLRSFQETIYIIQSRPNFKRNTSLISDFNIIDDPLNIRNYSDLRETVVEGIRGNPVGVGLTVLEMAYRTLREGDQTSIFQGVIIGYAYTIAYMAQSLTLAALTEHTHYRVPGREPTTTIPGVTLITRPFSDGYRQGRELAIRLMERLDTSQSESPTRPSIDFLIQLRNEIPGDTNTMFRGILTALPSQNIIPSSLRQ